MIRMKKKIKEFGMVFVSATLFSFAANFIWESLHAAFLYEGHDFNAKKYVRMVTYVSSIDSLLIAGIYLFIATAWRDLFWLREMNRRQKSAVLMVGMAVAAVIEYRKVFVLKIWEYNQLMPTLFGIGVSPLLQLSITGMLAFWLTRRFMYRKGIYSQEQ